MAVLSQLRQKVCETLSQKTPSPKRVGGLAQGLGPQFKFQLPSSPPPKKRRERLTMGNKGLIHPGKDAGSKKD
jgi:hypothetical protein